MQYFLVDNGSLRAESVLNLRRVAAELSRISGLKIIPASLLHSNRVPAEELNGEPAVNLEAMMKQLIKEGERAFTIIPFFIGPTGALVEYFPVRLEKLRRKYGPLEVLRTPFIYAGKDSGILDVAGMLADRVRQRISESKLWKPRVVLVDHGSPLETVTDVRNEISLQLADLLVDEVEAVSPASMERREGVEYDFNEPLLEKLLRREGWNTGDVVISMLFLSPGRHAGPRGDVASICRKAESESLNLRTHICGLIGTHPDIVQLLASRLEFSREIL